MDRTPGDGADSAEDSGSSQPYPSTLPGIPKAIITLFAVNYTLFMLFLFTNRELNLLGQCYVSFLVVKPSFAEFRVLDSCRAVQDSCFRNCRDRWRRIPSSPILRRSFL